MSELTRIPPYLHPKVAGIEGPEYAGKLTGLLRSNEQVDLAVIGAFADVWDPKTLASVRLKPALIVATDQRLLIIRPIGKSLFGSKTPAPLIASFAPEDGGNVFDAGYVRDNPRRATASICGPAGGGMSGSFSVWVFDVGDADNGNLWAVRLRDNAETAGGTRRRPNGL